MISKESEKNQFVVGARIKKRNKTTVKFVNEEITSVLDGIGDPIFILDESQIVIGVNKASCNLFQKKPEDIVGRHCYEIVHRTDHPSPGCPAIKALESKEVVSGEIEDSILNVPLLVTTSPTFDDNGRVKQITHIAKDISKIKAASRKIEVMNEKLHVLSSLTRHDVRNKLSVIAAYGYTLKKRHGDQPDLIVALNAIEDAVEQSSEIFDFAGIYENLGIEDLSYVDVEANVNHAYSLFSGQFPEVKNECIGLKVLADSFLRQLFYNFMHNTVRHGKKATVIRIHYRQNADSLRLIYEDNGVGIPSENKLRLFRERFSTGGSTGYGLFLIKKMMDVYGWQIVENGEPGHGARFVITIPHDSKIGQVNYQIQAQKS